MTQPNAKLHPGLNLGHHHGEAHNQAETVVFGFWVFLMSDLILFGLTFASYITLANKMGMASGPTPADIIDLVNVFAQTVLLLVSSLTFGVASLTMRHKMPAKVTIAWLGLSLVLGLAFLGLAALDFLNMANQGAVPSRSGYLSGLWSLVGLHAVHVTAGCFWIMIMIAQIAVLGLHPIVKSRVLRLGLFWHFLDIVWIGIFSIVYLGGLL